MIIEDLGLQVVGELRDAPRGGLAHARVAVVGARAHLRGLKGMTRWQIFTRYFYKIFLQDQHQQSADIHDIYV